MERTESLLNKCPNCNADVFKGQRFCSFCGTKLETTMRTKEEVEALKNRLHRLNLDSLPSIAIAFSIGVVLTWVLGETSNEQIDKLLETLEGKKMKL